MFEEAVSFLSLASSMNAWLTPTVLFLLLNLTIASIALSSAFHHRPRPLHPHPSSLLLRLKSVTTLSPSIHFPQPPLTRLQPHSLPVDSASAEEDGPTLDEVYSQIVRKGNSDTRSAGGEVPMRLPRRIKKSALSHIAAVEEEQEAENTATATADPGVEVRRNVAVTAAEVGGGGYFGVDARADDFINRFREQLKLQRLESWYGTTS